LITHISFSILEVSLDLDSLLSLLLPPKHTAVDSYLPRKFVSSQTEAGHASAARPSQTLQVSAPREICASIQRLDLPALHFRTRADMPWPLSAAPNQHVPRSVTVSKIISYRVHAIAAACQSFESLSLLASWVPHNRALAVSSFLSSHPSQFPEPAVWALYDRVRGV
jgi:hypothetical protein